ncbi:MAG: hypothetical protein ACM3ZQ_09520 [Bacillota bacterium]
MQSEAQANANRTWVPMLAALASLEALNLILWMVLSFVSRLMVSSGIVVGVDYQLMITVGAYPVLLLSPLMTKWCFRECSLLPLYLLNLAQMGVVTWRVVY